MTTLSNAMFNFSAWDFSTGNHPKRLFSLRVQEAGPLPDETRILRQGFIEALFEPFTPERVRVTSQRPSADAIEGAFVGARA